MMKAVFAYRDMTTADVESIMSEIWAPGAAELDLLGVEDAKALLEKIQHSASHAWAFSANGAVVAICGTQRKEDTYYTWFMATPRIADIGGEFTMWLRRFCREKVEQEGVKLEMCSASRHPNSDRWFKALRFEKYDEQGLIKFYRYNPKNKLTDAAE